MKKLIRIIACVLMLTLAFTVFMTGCGSKTVDVTTGAVDEKTTAAESTAVDAAKDVNTQTAVASGKKIVIVQEDENSWVVEQQQNAVKALERAGYTSQNSEITTIKLGGDEKKSQETVDRIKQIKPDVVIIDGDRFSYAGIAKPLDGTGIPVIVNMNADTKDYGFLDEKDMPKGNVTGLFTMPRDMLKNAYAFLNEVSPNNGKKAVFITAPGMFTKEQVEAALKSSNIELKAYEEYKYVEDYEKAVLKYNADNEVGWVLIGISPFVKKGDIPIEATSLYKWEQENFSKPDVTYWEVAVQLLCIPCGLAVDTASIGTQTGEIAIRILKGEDIKNIQAESPKKINIVLNKMAADKMGIQFSVQTMTSASKIYTDYKGNYME